MRGAWEPRTALSLSDERRPVLGAAVRATPAPQLTASCTFAARPSARKHLKCPEIGQSRGCGRLRAESLSVRRLGTLPRPSGPTPRAALIAPRSASSPPPREKVRTSLRPFFACSRDTASFYEILPETILGFRWMRMRPQRYTPTPSLTEMNEPGIFRVYERHSDRFLHAPGIPQVFTEILPETILAFRWMRMRPQRCAPTPSLTERNEPLPNLPRNLPACGKLVQPPRHRKLPEISLF